MQTHLARAGGERDVERRSNNILMVCLESDLGDGYQEREPRRKGDHKAEQGSTLGAPSGCQILKAYKQRGHAEQREREIPQQA